MTAKHAKAPISELRFLRDYRAWRGAVDAARAARTPEAAIARGRELAARYPERVEVHRMLGELYMDLGESGPSIEAFRHVLRLDPGDGKNRLRLARALGNAGTLDEALDVMLPAVEDAPTPRNLVKLAGLHRQLGQDEEAFAVLERAMERNPGHQPALEALAAVAGDLGRTGEAERARAALEAVRPKLSTAEVVERIDAARPGDAPRYVVNIGCRDGIGWEDPCYALFQRGYPGVAVDAGNFPELCENLPQPEVRKLLDTPVTPANVLEILAGEGCPERLSLLKIDIDSFDGVVLAAALEGLRPNVIQIEINPEIPPPLRFAIEYHPRYRHSGEAGFFGCSVAYLVALCRPLGYELLEIDMSDPPLRQDVILVLREYLPIFDVTAPVDERELFLREPVALGAFRAVGADSASWRARTDYDALLEEVQAACKTASRRRSGEVLPFTLER